MTPEFLLTAFVVALLPGTGVVYTLSVGLTQGRRASLYAALGCTFGIVPHLAATALGLAALLHTSAVAFQIVKFAGVVYLLYLAWQMWRESGTLGLDGGIDRQSGWRIIRRAVLINVLNPKLSIFFLAFLPQFIARDAVAPLGELLMLGGTFMLVTLVVFAGYGLLADAARRIVTGSPVVIARIQKACAGLFVLLGARLALAER